MKQVYRFDEEGYYIEPVIVGDEIPDDCTEVPLPQPNWKPKWNGEEWEETITQEELEEQSRPQPNSPTKEERIAALERALLLLIMGG